MQRRALKTDSQTQRIASIDLLRGVVMIIMALDHVRMYFALGIWYSEPTDLATTTPLLFFTRWITHFCYQPFLSDPPKAGANGFGIRIWNSLHKRF